MRKTFLVTIDTDNDVFDNALYNDCYHKVARKAKWRNRDFDYEFDNEVYAMYVRARTS